MTKGIGSNHRRTLQVKLSHPEVGEISAGSISFGYSCFASISHDDLGHDFQFSDA